MKTFFNILQTLVDIKDKKYPGDPFTIAYKTDDLYSEIKSHIMSLINHIFYAEQQEVNLRPQYNKNALAKLKSLNTIIENSFYENQLKEEITTIFSKSQKHYLAFSKFARIYKSKKYLCVVTDDLSLNALDPIHKNTFTLIDNKSKYLFSLNDLISIIETAIGHSPQFFSEPLRPLNPYNKQPFTISTLYNIYFKMKESGRLISVLFHFFFLENFNMFTFSEHYEHYIRENSIKKYVFNSPYNVLYHCVFDMLDNNPYTQRYNIHPEFPKETLVNIFRPFLYYYYIINYDLKGTNKISNYNVILYNKLCRFYQYNKAFGRKYLQITRMSGKIIKKEYKFNTNHVSFYGVCFNTKPTKPTIYAHPTTNMVFHNNTNTILTSTDTSFLYTNPVFNNQTAIDQYSLQEELDTSTSDDDYNGVYNGVYNDNYNDDMDSIS